MSPNNSCNDFPGSVPGDLKAARDAVADLVAHLLQTVDSFRGRPDCGTKLPLGIDLLPERVRKLKSLTTQASRNYYRVRGELIDASNSSPTAHQAVIEHAKTFCVFAESLKRGSESTESNKKEEYWQKVQLYLAFSSLKIHSFQKGIGDQDAQTGIDYEMRRAAEKRVVKYPGQNRLRCDSSDRSIWLDDKQVASGLEADVFEYLEVLAATYPEAISLRKIRGRVQTLPENDSRFNCKVDRAMNSFSTRQIGIERIRGRGHVLKFTTD